MIGLITTPHYVSHCRPSHSEGVSISGIICATNYIRRNKYRNWLDRFQEPPTPGIQRNQEWKSRLWFPLLLAHCYHLLIAQLHSFNNLPGNLPLYQRIFTWIFQNFLSLRQLSSGSLLPICIASGTSASGLEQFKICHFLRVPRFSKNDSKEQVLSRLRNSICRDPSIDFQLFRFDSLLVLNTIKPIT